jgi:hypothetical protein
MNRQDYAYAMTLLPVVNLDVQEQTGSSSLLVPVADISGAVLPPAPCALTPDVACAPSPTDAAPFEPDIP